MEGAEEINLACESLIEVGHKVADWGVEYAWEHRKPEAEKTGEEATQRFTESAHPAIRRLKTFTELANLYKSLAQRAVDVDAAARVSDWCADLAPDARELALTGHVRHITPAALAEHVGIVEEALAAQLSLEAKTRELTAKLARAERDAQKAKAEPKLERKMSRELWLRWMASLPENDAELTDADPIEERLEGLGIEGGHENAAGEESLINWYVGDWHSDADSREGVRRARVFVEALDFVGQTGTATADSQNEFGHPEFHFGNGYWGGRVDLKLPDGARRNYFVKIISNDEPSQGGQVVITAVESWWHTDERILIARPKRDYDTDSGPPDPGASEYNWWRL